MRPSKSIVSGILFSLAFCGIAMAAPTAPAGTAAPKDCQQVGGEVSALIDEKTGAPNLAAARAAFQVGVMNCMEGDENSANGHYLEAMRLLGEPVALRPAPVKPAPSPQVVTRDCQDVGSEVSALIDAKAGSPNLPAARASFQIGIMQCMEGDDVSAGKHYEDAKKLLSQG